MIRCLLNLPTPAENLACDEALLDGCEAGEHDEVLRFWESDQHFVVLGYANRADSEVNRDFCASRAIPILRRCTGGGTVLQGPGCLNYSLILQIGNHPELIDIRHTNRWIMERNRAALEHLVGEPVEIKGHTDLAVRSIKFSGNAQRRRRQTVLFHGTFLLDADLQLIHQSLPMPSQQPDYRANRSHREFLKNLNLPASEVISTISDAWGAADALPNPPLERIRDLVEERYSQEAWNLKF